MKKSNNDKKMFDEIFSFPTLPNVSDYPRRVKEMAKELKKLQEGDGYFVSVDNGSSNYNIHSKELKKCLRNLIFSDEFWKRQGEGQRFTEGSFFSYKEGVNDTPDIFKIKEKLLENEIIPPQIRGTSSSQIVEIDDDEAEKQKAEGVKTISSQEIKENQLEENKKKKNKLNVGQGQLKEDNNKKDKGGNAGLFTGFFLSSAVALAFGLFLVGQINK